MKPHAVCDIGNTCVKWGLCAADGSRVTDAVSLPDDLDAWKQQQICWASRERERPETSPVAHAPGSPYWVLASVRPQRCAERLEHWLLQQGYRVRILQHAVELPVEVKLPAPEKAGIDRLLNAVAARKRLRPGEPAVLIDAGSAITVDWLDEGHAFCGGTIFPGLGLMAQALHDHTALLPLVAVPDPPPDVPAQDTAAAMQAGIFHTAAGGIERIVRRLVARSSVPPRVFLTGGDGPLLSKTLDCVLWPWQTLEGILASVEQSE